MRKLTLLLALIATSAMANDKVINETARRSGFSVEDVKKWHKAGCDTGSPSLMYLCGEYGFVESDLKLNETYKALLRKMQSKGSKEKLRSVQKAWLAYRDKTCEFEALSYLGGRDYQLVYVGCLTTQTTDRIMKLEEYLACNDAGCPGAD